MYSRAFPTLKKSDPSMQQSDHENTINSVNIIPIQILLNHTMQNIKKYF